MTWRAMASQHRYVRPEVGDLVPMNHGVWRITGVDDQPILEDADRDAWVSAGMPDIDTWRYRPYRVEATHVGGYISEKLAKKRRGVIRVGPSTPYISWDYYPGGRWPQCSCCGEPMPCRAELQDRAVDQAQERMATIEKRMPGCCWSCEEVITRRQRRVTYPGINLDHPTGPTVMFHLRQSCVGGAYRYEARWLEAGVGRERVLTYPKCAGQLIVHHDGTTECHGGDQDCWGHETHDHSRHTACFVQGHGCGRDCPREGHPGTRMNTRRPRESEHLS